jgi:hypothetical protein
MNRGRNTHWRFAAVGPDDEMLGADRTSAAWRGILPGDTNGAGGDGLACPDLPYMLLLGVEQGDPANRGMKVHAAGPGARHFTGAAPVGAMEEDEPRAVVGDGKAAWIPGHAKMVSDELRCAAGTEVNRSMARARAIDEIQVRPRLAAHSEQAVGDGNQPVVAGITLFRSASEHRQCDDKEDTAHHGN